MSVAQVVKDYRSAVAQGRIVYSIGDLFKGGQKKNDRGDGIMKLEQEIDQLIILEAAKYGIHMWRNNSGMLYDRMNTPVRFGLGNSSAKLNSVMKSSDRIGPTPVIITQSMVGQLVGIFTAVEVKAEDWQYKGTEREVAQKNFIDIVKKAGGFAGFANSVDMFKLIVGR